MMDKNFSYFCYYEYLNLIVHVYFISWKFPEFVHVSYLFLQMKEFENILHLKYYLRKGIRVYLLSCFHLFCFTWLFSLDFPALCSMEMTGADSLWPYSKVFKFPVGKLFCRLTFVAFSMLKYISSIMHFFSVFYHEILLDFI